MSELEWNDEKGWGFQPGSFDYGDGYWEEFREKDDTPMGRVLTALRVGFVAENIVGLHKNTLLDVGIGGGAFLEKMVYVCMAVGTDVNPKAVDWLAEEKALWNKSEVDVMTFWDSLEHIKDPSIYLDRAKKWVFVSTPIYRDKEDCLTSKHYKPGEHLWYFTHAGMVAFMKERGFILWGSNNLESDAGREGIGTYVFRRNP